MGTNNNYSQQFDDENQEAEEWQQKEDFEDDAIESRKEKLNLQDQEKAQIRRNIEDFKEQQRLKEFLGDDYDD